MTNKQIQGAASLAARKLLAEFCASISKEDRRQQGFHEGNVAKAAERIVELVKAKG